ncbi:MAG: peptidoglycan editing factor PgeF, partial [Bdellovibrionales bacterium]
MLDPLTAINLNSVPSIRHGFFTRQGGVSEGIFSSLDCGLSERDPEQAAENRRRVAETLGAQPDRLLSCHQVHSPDVLTAGEPWPLEKRPKADAMVTKEKGIALGILTADCGPLLFADQKAGVIGAAHAGWRGALTGVIENTVEAMEKLGAARKHIVAAIGPCIWQNSYEVGPEFPAPFLAENPDFKRFFRPAFRSDRYMFDLPGYLEAKLRMLGLAAVDPSPADTLADEARFFSYRRACLNGE